ncbi:14904_t:CDS:2 [Racocetra fulgida]|uniref:14904_t:CDS:1 n=1 Tax=Racocetra fulgida TaxID=60492 RepID=A0A9N8WJH5_9GLOM|nr:14904_t:CDS:2 [Racocetra fulgida]
MEAREAYKDESPEIRSTNVTHAPYKFSRIWKFTEFTEFTYGYPRNWEEDLRWNPSNPINYVVKSVFLYMGKLKFSEFGQDVALQNVSIGIQPTL